MPPAIALARSLKELPDWHGMLAKSFTPIGKKILVLFAFLHCRHSDDACACHEAPKKSHVAAACLTRSAIASQTFLCFGQCCTWHSLKKKRKSVSETHEDGGRRLRGLTSEVATVPESTPAGFCVFLSDPKSKFCEKPDADSLFNFGRSRSPV